MPNHRTIEIRGGSNPEFTSDIEAFKKDRGIGCVVAFSGSADFSSPLLDGLATSLFTTSGDIKADANNLEKAKEKAADDYISSIVRDVLNPLRSYRIAVLTGGTMWGVPKAAAAIAKNLGFTTIGVFPLRAKQKAQVLPDDVLDLSICVHPFVGNSSWGDESAIYTKLLNAVVIIGGRAGTMIEVTHLLKYNEPKDIAGGRVKHLVPILGTGGTADVLPFFPGKLETMAKCLPKHPLLSGAEACEYLKETMHLGDYYD